MKLIVSLITMAALVAFAQAPSPRTATWGGLAFGMTKDEVKAAIKSRKDRKIETEEARLLVLSGKIASPMSGVAALTFSDATNGLKVVRLDFKADLECADGEQSSREVAICRIARTEQIVKMYRERYGKPAYEKSDTFPGIAESGDTEREIHKFFWNSPIWANTLDWKWREAGQEISFSGALLGSDATVYVWYSPERHDF